MTSNLPSRTRMPIDGKQVDVRPADGAQIAAQHGFSVTQTTCYRWSLDEAVVELQQLGVRSIGLWRTRLLDFGVERTIDLLRDSGMTASSLAWTGGFTGSNGMTFDEAVDDARSMIETAAELRAPVVHVATGGRNSHANGHLRRMILEALDSLSRLAEDCRVVLAVHPMATVYQEHWTFLHSIRQALELIDTLQHPHVKLGLNPYHIGKDPDLGRLLDDRVDAIGAVMLSDTLTAPRCENDACMIGRGTLPLEQFVRRCKDGGYAGHMELDVWSETLWKQGDYASSLLGAIEDFANWCAAPQTAG